MLARYWQHIRVTYYHDVEDAEKTIERASAVPRTDAFTGRYFSSTKTFMKLWLLAPLKLGAIQRLTATTMLD